MTLYDETAPWYDVVHDALVDHAADVETLRGSFARHATRPVRRVLDLGCGTGTHAILLAQAGFDVDALDASEGQLAVARAKVARAGAPSVRLHHADMAAEPPRGEWDAVVSLSASFTYLVDDAVAERALRALAARVPGGGVLVLDVWDAERARSAKTFDRFAPESGAEVVRLAERALVAGVVYLAVETLVLEGERVARRVRESHRMRARTERETRALLEGAGWRVRAYDPRGATGRATVVARR